MSEVNVSVVQGLAGAGVNAIVALTQAEYDALPTKDSTTLYIITAT
jgi:hypothetical protein